MAVLRWLLSFALEFVWNKGVEMFNRWRQYEENRKKRVEQAAKDAEKAKNLPPDAGPKETDEAIDDQLNRL